LDQGRLFVIFFHMGIALEHTGRGLKFIACVIKEESSEISSEPAKIAAGPQFIEEICGK